MSNQNFSRRNFIGLTGLAGAGLVLPGNPLMAAQPLRTEEMYAAGKFKIGIIGCGNRSKTIISSLNSVPELEMTALCDIVPHKMGQRAELIKTGVKPKFVNSLGELLQMKELDAIFVITPNDTHRDIVIAALEAGKHVWCEKPLAMTVAECNDILGAVARTGRLMQVGNQRRHSPAYKTLVDVVRNKPLGQILQADLFDYRGDWRVPDADEYPAGTAYWRMSQKRSGGVVYEMGAHIIDVNNWVMDSEPVSVFSLQGVNNFTLRKRDSSDHAGVLVQFANGAMMNYGGNVYNYGASAMDTWFCEKGSVQMGGGKVYVKYGSPAGFLKPANMPQNEEVVIRDDNREGDGATEQLRHFVKVLDGKEKPYPDGYIGRMAVQVMEGANRSAVARRAIDVRELG
jgi:predicted dehydrogenase